MQNRHSQAWIFDEERVEVDRLYHERLDRLDGDDARRPTRPAEGCLLAEEVDAGSTRTTTTQQGHLTEEVSWPEVVGRAPDVNRRRSRQDHKQAARIGASFDQRFPSLEGAPPTGIRYAREVFVRQLIEEAQATERLYVPRHVAHRARSHPPLISRNHPIPTDPIFETGSVCETRR